MMGTYTRDIARTIQKGSRRFLALMVITILGVAMFSGLQAACEDLRRSADLFFDAQELFDLRIFSTLGLTEEDRLALEALDGVETAEGSWQETADVHVGDRSLTVNLVALTGSFNQPYLLEGRLPEAASEAAVPVGETPNSCTQKSTPSYTKCPIPTVLRKFV